MTPADLGLLVRTAAALRPAQIVARVRLRGQREAWRRWPALAERAFTGRPLPTGGGWPAGFTPVDVLLDHWPHADELREGHVTLLGRTGDLGAEWDHGDAPQLWRFHLHYWDWAHGLAPCLADRAVFARLWRSWRAATPIGRGDAWSPYVVSLRAWSWCAQYARLVAGTDLEDEFRDALAVHLRYLRWHLERDVGGNHLMKNLKAVVGLGVFLGHERAVEEGVRDVAREVERQVLPDGGHYERAPAYHCQVLADLVDVVGLLRAADRTVPPVLADAVHRMRRWLGAILGPDGRVPMLNDGYPVPAAALAALAPAPAPTGVTALADSGLVAASTGPWHLLADIGDPCPRDLPAHAHADTLSFLLWLGARPFLVDTATSTYAPGPRRAYERSTAAHSTAVVDGRDSTEVWGAFRAARLAHATLEAAASDGAVVSVRGSHDGYERGRAPVRHRRSWTIEGAEVTVRDRFEGVGEHDIALHWHLDPALGARLEGDDVVVAAGPPVRVRCAGPGDWEVVAPDGTEVAVDFERLRPATTLRRSARVTVPATWTTTFIAEHGPDAPPSARSAQ